MFQKLFTAKQIKEIDNQTITKQKITSEALMERAASALFEHLLKKINIDKKITLFCGVGNNGGDGLVLARFFSNTGFKDIQCVIVPFSDKQSDDFKINYQKLTDIPVSMFEFDPKNPPKTDNNTIIIDAIFGTGLSRPATGIAAEAIKLINQSDAKVYSVDVPSGLYVDASNKQDDIIVKADEVLTFQFPKISFFFSENSSFVPQFEVVDIGLDTSIMEQLPTSYFMIKRSVKNIFRTHNKTGYKNSFGHALMVGGSYGMIGAVVLAAKAALRSGAGLVTAFIPRCGYDIMQIAIPEVMCKTDVGKKKITSIKIPQNIQVVGIGPGMGTRKKTQAAFKTFLEHYNGRLLIDADALNILSLHPRYFKYVPAQTILTPHPGEFKRLAGSWKNDTEKLKKLLGFAKKYNLVVVLKGAYTTITDGEFYYINPVANPALATAGSGDVLTGIITGLLAQGYQPLESALLGVYWHSKTAEVYNDKPIKTMIATDIIRNLTKY